MRKDLTGLTFNRLTVLEFYKQSKPKKPKWLCLCSCGNKKVILGESFKSGATKSCGCLHIETITNLKLSHRKCSTREYNSWSGLIQRCTNSDNPGFKNYGDRGIEVCNRWLKSFDAFYEDMGECPEGFSIDRINNNLGYNKSNCKWSSRAEQNTNQRSNIIIEFNNKSQCISEWAKQLGIKYATLYNRLIVYKWPIEKALKKYENFK